MLLKVWIDQPWSSVDGLDLGSPVSSSFSLFYTSKLAFKNDTAGLSMGGGQ